MLAGAWCHACGQSAEEFHRSFLRLAAEAFGGLIDIDNRVWRTVPKLLLQPGRLTRQYLDGHRAAQAPPFRMFLIGIVLIFLVASVPGGGTATIKIEPLTGFGVPAASVSNVAESEAAKWLQAHVAAISQHQQAFQETLITWAQRLAVLTLPISALLLSLTFFWRRDILIFDHLIFSMHSLTFLGFLVSAVMLLARLTDWAWLLLLAAPAHLFVHLRGAYGIGVFSALARMVVLLVGSLMGFYVLLVGLIIIGLYEIGA
ncbi:MAG TPA: DUF3667 domain-containing protein [Caulobacteraceae bacterium]|nr:DUF3667 domain-containing protein [Caulobacteraceae bacterium]